MACSTHCHSTLNTHMLWHVHTLIWHTVVARSFNTHVMARLHCCGTFNTHVMARSRYGTFALLWHVQHTHVHAKGLCMQNQPSPGHHLGTWSTQTHTHTHTHNTYGNDHARTASRHPSVIDPIICIQCLSTTKQAHIYTATATFTLK